IRMSALRQGGEFRIELRLPRFLDRIEYFRLPTRGRCIETVQQNHRLRLEGDALAQLERREQRVNFRDAADVKPLRVVVPLIGQRPRVRSESGEVDDAGA